MSTPHQPPGERPAAPRPPGTLRLGEIGGVDVLVRYSWVLFAALIAVAFAPEIDQVQPGMGAWKYVAGFMLAILLFLSVLLHEMSHAQMAKRYGHPVRSITLHFFGGETQIEGEARNPREEFGMSVVGPITSIAVGLACLLVLQVMPGGLLSLTFRGLVFVNIVVGALNLLPGLPLDGGRVLRAGVWKLTGSPHRGTIVAAWTGRVLALVALGAPLVATELTGNERYFNEWIFPAVVFAFVLWSGASASLLSAKVRARLPQLHARAIARRSLGVAPDLPLSEAVRRAREEQAGAIITVTASGQPIGIVSEAALLATPEDRRPWLATSTAARQLEEGMVLPADIGGEELVRAMQRTPASEYLLVEADGSVYGVLTAVDVDRAFAATR